MMPAHRSSPVAPLVVSALVLGATFASGVPADSEAVPLRRYSAASEWERLVRDVSRLAPAQRDDVVVEPSVSIGYVIGTAAVIAGGLTIMAVNTSLLPPEMSREASGMLGIGVGVFGLALGVSTLSAVGIGDDQQTLALLNTAVGSLSVLAGVYALATPAPRSPRPRAKPEAAASLRAAPWVGPGGAGMQVRLRF